MSESRYKIEYVQKEPSVENNVRFFGAFGYLWLALLTSVLIYGIVFKHIPTSQIVSFFQNIKTEVIDTEISNLIKTKDTSFTTNDATFSPMIDISNESGENQEQKKSHKLVSEIINDDQLPEDVIFESETVESVTNQIQQEDTDKIATEIDKDKKIQERKIVTAAIPAPAKSIENATNAIEKEIEKNEIAAKKNTADKKHKESKDDNDSVSMTAPEIKESKVRKNKGTRTFVETKNPLAITLPKLVEGALANLGKNDRAYIEAVNDYQVNKIADDSYLGKIKTQESKTTKAKPKGDKLTPQKKKISDVDAIIAAMNTEKKVKNNLPLSYKEKLQAEVNELLKNK